MNNFLRYDPETGNLFWRVSRGRVKAGQKAGSLKPNGYLYVCVNGEEHTAQRWVWYLNNGEWPTHGVDHINGIKTDNRLENLRLANQSENMRNTPVPRNNSSGYKGVYFLKCRGKYRAQIKLNGRNICLGNFDTLEDAINARAHAEHTMYGEFRYKG